VHRLPEATSRLAAAVEVLASRVAQLDVHVDLDVLDASEGLANSYSGGPGLRLAELLDAIDTAGARIPIAGGKESATLDLHRELVRLRALRHRSTMSAIDLAGKLATFSEYWQPRTVAEFNGNDVMVVKTRGEFVWHKHDDTDDFFLVLKGTLVIELRDRSVTVGPGQLFIVPKGVEHRPVANEEVHVLLIEPRGTPNTGDVATAQPRRVV
jgi:mannose-6-phosphate isomerase-like protein (cupin superfamily)